MCVTWGEGWDPRKVCVGSVTVRKHYSPLGLSLLYGTEPWLWCGTGHDAHLSRLGSCKMLLSPGCQGC